ncbi:DUF5719 family protein [Microbacterium gubbeenense]|uniref:DUF5719 family protein n=1 Tax=Microbacterium gubbeenense TaxID=159896 RepID=UPI003F97996F
MTRRTIRIVAGSAAGVVLAAAAVAASFAPWPTVSATGPGTPAAPQIEVTPAAGQTVLACDGPLLALGRDAADASKLASAADMAVTSGAAAGDGPVQEADIGLPDVGTATSVTQDPVDGAPVSVAAATSASLEEADLRGFAASSCRPGSPESWIAGSAVETGTTDVLVIANPSDVTATVQLSVYGVDGRTTPAGGEIAVPAHEQRAVPVASIAGGEETPVIRVIAEGAPVRTSLQSSTMRTLDPYGVDLQPGVLPAREAVVPHVHVTQRAAQAGEDPTQVRVLGTSGESGSVDIDVVEEDSGESVFSTTAELTADVPVSVGFDGLEAGNYAVRLSGDVPFVSAVRQAASDDYAWFAPGEPLEGSALVAAPASPIGSVALSFAALGDEGASVEITPIGGGDTQTVELAPGRADTTSVPAEATYTVNVVSGSVSGLASVGVDGSIGGFPIDPDPALPEPVTIVP